MPTVRKVTSKVKIAPKPQAAVAETQAPTEAGEEKTVVRQAKKVCYFCESKTEPKYTDVQTLRRFVSDRGRIVARGRSGACAKHQRRIAREVKHARHLALLPFTVQV